MKIYIMSDLEGVSGIRSILETKPGTPQYLQALPFLVGDVNAAIAGAFDGGASEVWVCDAHCGGNNLPLSEMDPRAKYCGPGGWRELMLGLDESFAGYFSVGFHAMAGTANAFLDHTMNGITAFEYTINGVPYGELGLQAIQAGALGVAQLLVSGDKAACAEAEALTPGIKTVAVKEAFGREVVVCLHPRQAQEAIRQAAQAAVALAGKLKPFILKAPYDMQLTYTRSDYADAIWRVNPRLQRINGRTLRYVTENVADLLLMFSTVPNLRTI